MLRQHEGPQKLDGTGCTMGMKRSFIQATIVGFLLGGTLSWPQVAPSVEPAAATSRPRPAHSPRREPHNTRIALAQTIRVGNADVPVTEIVPGTEVALGRLQEILNKIDDPELRNVQQQLDTVSGRIEQTREETLRVARNTRSTEEVSETRIPWRRDQRKLDDLSNTVQSHVQSLLAMQRQVREIQDKWSLADTSITEAALPKELLERIQRVQEQAAKADGGLRTALESLLQLQVEIAEKRSAIDSVLQEIDVAEEKLQESVFVLDSPPLWSALRGSTYVSLKEQARTTALGTRSRTISFYLAYRNNLIAYFILFLVLAAVFHRFKYRLGRQSVTPERVELRIFQVPFSLAAFTALFVFGFFFSKAPPEIFRLARLILIIPTVRIALKEFEDELHTPAVALAILYALDILSSHSTAGTALRRVLVLSISLVGLVGIGWMLRPGSAIKTLFVRRSWTVGNLFVRFAVVCLAAAAILNVVGSVLLADVVMHGTLVSMYAGMVVYLMCRAANAIFSLLSTTRLGQMSRMVRLHRELVLARAGAGLKLVAWIIWLSSALYSYQVFQPVYAGLRSILNYKWGVGAVAITLTDVCLFFLVLIAANVIARGIRFFLEEEFFPRTRVRASVAQAGSRLTHYALVLVGFFLAMAAAGVDMGRLTLLTGAFGVGLGFGMQSLVGNFVAGIMLSLERPMQIGDLIEARDLLGRVVSIGFRSTTIRTDDGADVIVPNSDLVTQSFVNWSRTDQFRQGQLQVRVAYGTEPARVLEMLLSVVASHPAVLKDPAPDVLFEQFGESALEFRARFWTSIEDLDRVRSELNVLVAEDLARKGVPIPLPQREVHLHMAESEMRDGGVPASSKRPEEGPGQPFRMKQTAR